MDIYFAEVPAGEWGATTLGAGDDLPHGIFTRHEGIDMLIAAYRDNPSLGTNPLAALGTFNHDALLGQPFKEFCDYLEENGPYFVAAIHPGIAKEAALQLVVRPELSRRGILPFVMRSQYGSPTAVIIDSIGFRKEVYTVGTEVIGMKDSFFKYLGKHDMPNP